MARARKNLDFVPSSYEELHTHYIESGIVKTLVRSFLEFGTEEEIEQLPRDIFLRCLDKKVIESYDPAKANFGGVIYFVTRSVCVNYLDRKSRDPVGALCAGTLTTEDPEDEVFVPGTWNLERFYVPGPDIATNYEASELVAWLVKFATTAQENPRNKRDSMLLPLLNLLIEEATPKECAEELNVTTTTITNWMKYLADSLQSYAAS